MRRTRRLPTQWRTEEAVTLPATVTDAQSGAVAARSAGDESVVLEALVGTGRAALTQGDYDQAESALGEGLTLARRLGEAHTEAVALVSLGELALRRGERDRPEALFREAAEAVAYATLRAGRRRSPAGSGQGLTPTERKIADLVVAGLTRTEVAERLFVSPETVKTHLANVYTKLAVRSRRQLRDALIGAERTRGDGALERPSENIPQNGGCFAPPVSQGCR